MRALLTALDRVRASPSSAEALLCKVCTGVPTSIAERLTAVAERSMSVSRVAAQVGDIPASVGEPRRARELLEFGATTPLDLGLEQLLAATRNQEWLVRRMGANGGG
jgi:hypothetical protein